MGTDQLLLILPLHVVDSKRVEQNFSEKQTLVLICLDDNFTQALVPYIYLP